MLRMRWLLVCVVAAVIGVGLEASAALAAGSDPMTAVAQGVDAANLPGSSVFGNTPANTAEQVSFVMRERNLDQLQSAAVRGFSHYLTVNQFAATYGQSPAVIAALRSYLASFGITTHALGDDVDIQASGTAGEFDQALAVQQRQYHVPAFRGHGGRQGIPAQTVHAASGSPQLPQSIARDVLAVLGLTNYQPFASHLVRTNPKIARSAVVSAADCVAATGLPRDCNTPADFASQYGLNGLYHRGAQGQGRTVAIVTLAAVDPGAPQAFWSSVAGLTPSGRTLTVQNIDGGPGAPSADAGSGETNLDLEQSGALAPDANVIDYQAPNTDPGFADGFFTAASQNTADTISTSWGESEFFIASSVASGTETPAYPAALDEAFLEMAAQGQSMFDAAGDEAAYDDFDEVGTTELNVDSPADSPYATAGGGTGLPFTGTFTGPDGSATITIPAQRIWGEDYTWAAVAATQGEPLATAAEDPLFGVEGTGGGFSGFYAEPPYQRGVRGTNAFSAVKYFTPTEVQNVDGIFAPTAFDFDPTPPLIHGTGFGRAVPDVSTDADPNTGYLLFSPSDGGLIAGAGGTSFVAPQLNGSTAVIDSFVGHRVGFWNPSVYSFATTGGSPFTPLNQTGTNNDNLFFTGTPGTQYNEGAGLGVPDLTRLGQDFATQR
jgi:kumamolisin